MTNAKEDKMSADRVRFQVPYDAHDFDKFLRINIHADDYIRLDSILNVSQHRLTKLKHSPDIITEEEVATLAPLLRISEAQLLKKIKYYTLNTNR